MKSVNHPIAAKANNRRDRKSKNASEADTKPGRSGKPKPIPPNRANPPAAGVTSLECPILDRARLKEMSLEEITEEMKRRSSVETIANTTIKDLKVLRRRIAEDNGFLGLAAKDRAGHGGFKHWFKEADLGISYTTLNRYMRLANKSLLLNLPPGASLSELYLEMGIPMEAEAEMSEKGETDCRRTKRYTQANFVAGVEGKTADMKAAVDMVQFEFFDPAGLEKLSAELADLIDVCTALKAKVEETKSQMPVQATAEGQPELPLKELSSTPRPPSVRKTHAV